MAYPTLVCPESTRSPERHLGRVIWGRGTTHARPKYIYIKSDKLGSVHCISTSLFGTGVIVCDWSCSITPRCFASVRDCARGACQTERRRPRVSHIAVADVVVNVVEPYLRTIRQNERNVTFVSRLSEKAIIAVHSCTEPANKER